MKYVLTYIAPPPSMGEIDAPFSGTMFAVQKFDTIESVEEWVRTNAPDLSRGEFIVLPFYEVEWFSG
jgi:hypothetical protein